MVSTCEAGPPDGEGTLPAANSGVFRWRAGRQDSKKCEGFLGARSHCNLRRARALQQQVNCRITKALPARMAARAASVATAAQAAPARRAAMQPMSKSLAAAFSSSSSSRQARGNRRARRQQQSVVAVAEAQRSMDASYNAKLKYT